MVETSHLFIGSFTRNLRWTEICRIDNWKREHIRQFLKEKVKPVKSDSWVPAINAWTFPCWRFSNPMEFGTLQAKAADMRCASNSVWHLYTNVCTRSFCSVISGILVSSSNYSQVAGQLAPWFMKISWCRVLVVSRSFITQRVLCACQGRAIVVCFLFLYDIWEIISLFMLSIIAGWYDLCRTVCILCRQ